MALAFDKTYGGKKMIKKAASIDSRGTQPYTSHTMIMAVLMGAMTYGPTHELLTR